LWARPLALLVHSSLRWTYRTLRSCTAPFGLGSAGRNGGPSIPTDRWSRGAPGSAYFAAALSRAATFLPPATSPWLPLLLPLQAFGSGAHMGTPPLRDTAQRVTRLSQTTCVRSSGVSRRPYGSRFPTLSRSPSISMGPSRRRRPGPRGGFTSPRPAWGLVSRYPPHPRTARAWTAASNAPTRAPTNPAPALSRPPRPSPARPSASLLRGRRASSPL
jgi:hypothetical protein